MQTTRNQLDAVGFDFGTTNSSVALLNEGSGVQLASFPSLGTQVESFRSVLYLEQSRRGNGPRTIHGLTGPAAIERYLQAEEKGRLIQSLKSHLSSRSLTGTEVFGRHYKLEDLIARCLAIYANMRQSTFRMANSLSMVGVAVRFVGSETRRMTTLLFRGCGMHSRCGL